MLDGLLGRGFASKWFTKTLIKLTKTRIDVIRRKRNATQKFLKKDIADLLTSGLDINAYGRADGLTAEVILSSCYDFVERCCDLVLKNLSVMQKQSECPEECKEPVSSLMIAAARFSDLPELRDLRQLFQERYANALELFVNQKFVENIASKPPTLEKKVQLMKDIAVEFSINWDSKAFVQSMSKPPSAIPQDKPKTYGPSHVSDDKAKLSSGKSAVTKGDKHNLFPTEKRLDFNDAQKLHKEKDGAVLKKEEHVHQTRHKAFGIEHKSLSAREDTVEKDGLGILFGERQEVASHKYEAWNRKEDDHVHQTSHRPFGKEHKSLSAREDTVMERDGHRSLFQERQQVASHKYEAWNRKEDAPPKSVRLGSSSQGNGQEKHHERENNVPKREHEALPCVQPIVAGPHVKSNGQGLFAGDNYGGQHSDAKLAIKEEEMPKLKPPYNYGVPPPYVKPNAKAKDRKHEAKDGSGSKRITKDPVAYNIAFVDNILGGVNVGSDDEDEMPAAAKANKHDHGKDRAHRDDASSNHIPKPRSSRARSSRSRSSHNDAGNSEDTEVAIRKTRSRRKDESRRGLQLLFDDEHYKKDEEERRMDELLIHYSKKPSNVEPEMSRRKSRSRHAHHHAGTGVKESPRQASRDESETVPTAVRSVSLPNQHSGPSEAPKVFARAASFQPDRSNPAKHVHPKLPDYEDLAAQFAALRGR